VLRAVAPQVGGPRVIAAAPEIMVAMGSRLKRKKGSSRAADQTPPAEAGPAAAPAPPSAITNDDVQRLTELAKLREQGILTDEEFAGQKAKILGTS
jgi:hypothetical protein